ncbi:unnamed protein product [Toxocara canis]|uniref:Uncharacterized protein n=1 Tax=Toxocara canis TaxID=6265 RepID=A0A183UT14_TOXCA|nr:unnamed protein product [Toxocara canis]
MEFAVASLPLPIESVEKTGVFLIGLGVPMIPVKSVACTVSYVPWLASLGSCVPLPNEQLNWCRSFLGVSSH